MTPRLKGDFYTRPSERHEPPCTCEVRPINVISPNTAAEVNKYAGGAICRRLNPSIANGQAHRYSKTISQSLKTEIDA